MFYAFFAPNGLAVFLVELSYKNDYEANTYYGENFCVALDNSYNREDVLLRSYYHFASGLVKSLPNRPSTFHEWNLAAEVWELSLDKQAGLKSEKIIAINAAAQNKIFSTYPQTKQVNLQARWSELVYADMLLGAGVLTNQNGAEGAAIRAAWDWIKDIRARSNVATNAITLLSDANTIVADAELILNNFEVEIANL